MYHFESNIVSVWINMMNNPVQHYLVHCSILFCYCGIHVHPPQQNDTCVSKGFSVSFWSIELTALWAYHVYSLCGEGNVLFYMCSVGFSSLATSLISTLIMCALFKGNGFMNCKFNNKSAMFYFSHDKI